MKKITTFILNCLHIRKVHSSWFVNVHGHKFHFTADKTKTAICRTETEKLSNQFLPFSLFRNVQHQLMAHLILTLLSLFMKVIIEDKLGKFRNLIAGSGDASSGGGKTCQEDEVFVVWL